SRAQGARARWRQCLDTESATAGAEGAGHHQGDTVGQHFLQRCRARCLSGRDATAGARWGIGAAGLADNGCVDARGPLDATLESLLPADSTVRQLTNLA